MDMSYSILPRRLPFILQTWKLEESIKYNHIPKNLYIVKSNHRKIHWYLMAEELKLYSLYLSLLVIGFPDQYKTIHCKSTNKNSVGNKWYHTFYNPLENLNQFVDKI